MELHILDETHAPALRALLGKNDGSGPLTAARWAVLVLAFLLPVWFIPAPLSGADPLGLPKQALLIVGAWTAFLLWSGASLLGTKFRQCLPIYIWAPLLALLSITAASAFFSLDRWGSLLGSEGAVSSSLATTAALIALAASVAGIFSGREALKPLLAAALGVSAAALLGLLQSLGLPLLPLSGGAAANTAGTLGEAANVAALGAVAAAGLLATGAAAGRLARAALISGFVVDLFFLAVIDAGRSWMVLALGSAVLIIIGLVRGAASTQTFLPAASGVVLAVLLTIFPTPIRSGLPSEVAVSLTGSFRIAWESAGRRLLGSGPGTFGLDYAAYRPREILATPLWDRRFDRPSSGLAQALAETGVPGLIAAVILLFVLFRAAFSALRSRDGKAAGMVLVPLVVALSAAVLFASDTMTGRFLFFLGLGCAAAAAPRPGGAGVWGKGTAAAIFLISLISAVASFGGLSMRIAGAAAASWRGGEGPAVLAALQSAGRRDPTEDAYPRGFASVLEKDIRSGRIPQDRRELELLISRGIEAAKRAVLIGLNEPENWGAEGALYAALSPGVQGAADFSIASYLKAEELEPSNPRWPLARGRVLLLRSAELRKLAQGENEAVRGEAARRINADLEAAIAAMNRAAELKPDYYPALFELAMAYGQAGRTDEAVAELETVARANPQDVGVAYQLGLLYYRQNDLSRAAIEFERAVALAPSFANARWFLSSVRERQGRLPEAIEMLEGLLRSLPNDPRITVKLRELRAGIRSEVPPAPLGE